VKQEKNFRVLILGHGEMGQAMERLLGHHSLQVWQRRPPPGGVPLNLEQAAADNDFIVFCLPATAHADIAARVAVSLRGDPLCLTIAKGLDGQGRLPATVLAEAVGAARVAVLYGPMISEEIRAGKPAFAECGTTESTSYERIAALYRGTALRLEASRDITGLSWSAILKNVYAMAFGMADELHLGDNMRGFLAVTALRELSAIVRHLGGEAATPYRLAGLGDLITTATSAGSHHHELGRLIVRGMHDQLGGEGVHTMTVLRSAGRFAAASFPLFNLVDVCLREPDTARVRLAEFLRHNAT